jgi:hypothetical protein
LTPSYTGRSSYDLLALTNGHVDGSSIRFPDVISSVRRGTGTGGFEVWLNQGPYGNEGYVGVMGTPIVANGIYYDATTGEANAVAVGYLNEDAYLDCVVGTKTSSLVGKIEVWFGNGTGGFTHDGVADRYAASGEVYSLAILDQNGDGLLDVAVGSLTNGDDKQGKIDMFLNLPSARGKLTKQFTVVSRGKVNALAAADIDLDGRTDLVAGTKTGTGTGEVELWLNNGTTLALADYAAADGPVLCVALGPIDYGNDYRDIVAGNSKKSLQIWFCDPYADVESEIIPTYESWADANTGGVVNAVAIAKLECPGDAPWVDVLYDVVIGTAVTSTSGEIIIYLNPYALLLSP